MNMVYDFMDDLIKVVYDLNYVYIVYYYDVVFKKYGFIYWIIMLFW